MCAAGGRALTRRQATLATLEAAVPASVGLAVRNVERTGQQVPGITWIRVGQASVPHLASRVLSHGRELPAHSLLDGRRPTGPFHGHVVIAVEAWGLNRDFLLVPGSFPVSREYLTPLQRCYRVRVTPFLPSVSFVHFPTCSLYLM